MNKTYYFKRVIKTVKPEKTENSNPTVENRENREHLKCAICPPNKGENSKRKAKHGSKKPKYKNKR